jgi:divalent metal cation (Fe/Co/Zn/Cd) transporter
MGTRRWSDIHSGAAISVFSIVWTVATSSVAVAVGLSNSSLVLVAFGCTGFLDAAGSAALVLHFRHALRHGALSDRHEAIALNVVTLGLVAVALATSAESVRRLVDSRPVGHTALGLAAAAASAVVLPPVSVVKRRLGRRIPSHALVADGWLSLVGGSLACVTVAGTILSDHGVGWADPTAALVVGVTAFAIAVWLRREASASG